MTPIATDRPMVFRVPELECPDCARRLAGVVAALPGVAGVVTDFSAGTLAVTGNVRPGRIVGVLRRHGYAADLVDGAPVESVFAVSGLDCVDCGTRLERALVLRPDVLAASADVGMGTLRVRHLGRVADLVAGVRALGHELTLLGEEAPAAPRAGSPRAWLVAAAGVLLAAALILPAFWPPARVLFYAAIAAGGYYPLRAALGAVRGRLALDINVLLTVAVVGAVALGELAEAATVVFLFSVGNLLEAHTLSRTRRSLQALLALRPRTARVRREHREQVVPADEIAVGDVVIIRPGDRAPVDGTVVAGQGHVDEAPLTGESVPVYKAAGARVLAGSVNGEAALEVRAERAARDSTLARIIHLVERAQAARAPVQRAVDRFAGYYTPAIIGGAAVMAVLVPPLLRQPAAPWVYRALALMVVSCPCALVISTPVAVVAAVGGAARRGVLIKGGAHLEAAGRVRAVALDKTGTLTEGRPVATEVVPAPAVEEHELLEVLAAVESRSAHPLAAAGLALARSRGVQPRAVSGFQLAGGKGARAQLDDEPVYVGSPRYLAEDAGLELGQVEPVIARLQEEGKTVVVVARGRRVLGVVGFADRLRPGSAQAVAALKRLGMERLVLLTGDHERTARAVAAELGLEHRAGLLPEDKVSAVRALVAEYGQAAMVGDGVNDAPALAAASVGIAMGTAGADVALETADIAIMGDDPRRVAYVLELGRKTGAVIRQNITFSLLTKAVAVGLVFPGYLTLWLAVVADTGTALLVTLNAMRLLGRPGGGKDGGAQGE